MRTLIGLLIAIFVGGLSVDTGFAQLPGDGREAALTDAEKLFGLALLWREVEYNFPFFDQVPEVDWEAAFRCYVRPVLESGTTVEYYRVLQRFLGQLRDGHTRVDMPDSILDRGLWDSPWISLREVERRAIVSHVGAELKDSVPVGSEILAVDGISAERHLREQVFPYLPASTEHVRWRLGIRGNTYRGWGLLVGPAGSDVRILLSTPAGDRREILTRRDRRTRESRWVPERTRRRSLLEYRPLGDEIAYVALNSFNEDSLVDRLDAIMPDLRRARGIVIDLRHNGGGRDRVVHEVLGRLTADTLPGPGWRTRVHNAAYRAWGRLADQLEWARQYLPYAEGDAWHIAAPDTFVAGPGPEITVPVVILIGMETASSAENFLVYLDGHERFTTVGRPTVGSSGQPLFLDLPGGGRAWIVTKRNTFPDGRTYIGVGIQPDVRVEPSVEDVVSDRDVILERGVVVLRERIASTGTGR